MQLELVQTALMVASKLRKLFRLCSKQGINLLNN